MANQINVVKRDGRREPKDIEKIHKVLMWACEGVSGVSVSQIEATADLKFFDGMKTSDVHEMLVSSAHDLISEATPNYDIVAGRLAMFGLRKAAYGQFEVPHILDVITKNIAAGWYHADILGLYTPKEWDTINGFIKHDNDFKFRISGAREWLNKYLMQNRATGEYKETPQIAYALISAILMRKYVDKMGLTIVKEYYNDLSTGAASIPSPMAKGIRSTKPQGASCTLIECGDSLDSIGATVQAILAYASNMAGLGVGIYNLRAAKQPVRGGEATTTGPVPFGQLMQAAVNSCSQGGMRKGSATFFHNIWHLDVKDLLVLKNNKGTEETRIRHADHGFNMNRYLFRKILKGEDITLFSPEEVPDLAKAFYADQDEFARLYEAYSVDPTVTKRVMSQFELRDLFVNERSSTSRVYFHFVDHSNEQGTFIPEFAPIKQSNLCLEITLPTIPLQYFEDPNGLISLCTLSAINWGAAKKPSDLRRACRNTVFALDSLLDYQPYLLPAARNSTDWYRPLGIGVNNLAYFLAKRGLRFNKEALEVVDEYMEAQAYYLYEASVTLAEMYGACGKYEHTKFSRGQFPMDNRKKAVDELVAHVERQPWSELRERMAVAGIRNATLMANMPSETSSRVHNMTNGGEPVRSPITTKSGTKLVIPEFDKLKDKYDYEWGAEFSLQGYIMVQAVMQKHICQAISLNTRYDPTRYPDGQVPATVILNDLALIVKLGLKTGYYHNNRKVTKRDDVEEVVVPVVVEASDAECESCVL